jgi:putative membrane protein
MLELLLFIVLGIVVGIIFGLAPGLHPNFLILMVPILFSLSISPLNLLVFIVAMAVANAISDFIPSILFGAPEEGTELSVMPGHKMLLAGQGYQAIKLAAIGGMFSIVFLCIIFPATIFIFPFIYATLSPLLFFLLAAIAIYMILTEKGNKKIIAVFCFFLSGMIGISLSRLPLDSTLSLFPVLSGLFGASTLLMQFRHKNIRVKNQQPEEYVSRRLVSRSVIFGSLGGIFSGILPGVGTSQIASLATVDKNEKSFLVTLGALSASNIMISIMSLWLISKARSGLAIMIGNFIDLTFQQVLLIMFVALLSAAISVIITLKLAKFFLHIIENVNYVMISKIIFIIISVAVLISTGFYGILLFMICTALGIFVHISKIKMSILMGVLLLPTIIFYAPF